MLNSETILKFFSNYVFFGKKAITFLKKKLFAQKVTNKV